MYCIFTIHSMGRTSTCTVYSPYNYTAVRCCIHAYVHMYMWHPIVQICTYVIAYVMLCARACTQYWNGALHNYIGTLCVHMHIRTYLRTYVQYVAGILHCRFYTTPYHDIQGTQIDMKK